MWYLSTRTFPGCSWIKVCHIMKAIYTAHEGGTYLSPQETFLELNGG